MIHSYKIKEMHCASCVDKVNSALSAVKGVEKVTVSLSPPEAVVEMNTHVTTSELNAAVGKVGSYSLNDLQTSADSTVASTAESVTPLFIILSYLLGGVLLRAVLTEDFSLHVLMASFMGGFFVLFSLFKMIDLQGFAEGYASYDLIAQRSWLYALSYPFIELTLGTLYLTGVAPGFTNLITCIVMAVGAAGVFKALKAGRKIQCACLGTALKLPMTKISLAEDVGMGFMALAGFLI